jgi:PLP dependent protein
MSISENVAVVRDHIVTAAYRAGRDPSSVTLMAVSKTFPAESIREAYNAGLRVFGENRVQEFAGKADSLRDLPGAAFHLIGHLKSNKAAKAVELFDAIDSVDSLRLAEKLNAAAKGLNKQLPILIEINIGGEAAKSGIAADSNPADFHSSDRHSEALEQVLAAAPTWNHLAIRGLMTIPPYTEDPEGSRSYFRRLRDLRDKIAARQLPQVKMDILSMGMSHDFEVAIEEGSTCIRIGTAIFGGRTKR